MGVGWLLGRRGDVSAPASPSLSQRRPAAGAQAVRAEDFAGWWAPASGEPDAPDGAFELRVEGDVVRGQVHATGASFDLRLAGHALEGQCVEPDRKTPVTMELTPKKDKMVVTLAPPESEYDISVCVRSEAPREVRVPLSPGARLTPEQAVAAVREHPEVREWLRLFKGPIAQRPRVEVNSQDETVYTVQVYEDVPGPPGEGHNATLGWFEVDKKTGKVTKVNL